MVAGSYSTVIIKYDLKFIGLLSTDRSSPLILPLDTQFATKSICIVQVCSLLGYLLHDVSTFLRLTDLHVCLCAAHCSY